MPPMGRILSLCALLHVSAATPFLTAPLGLPAAEAHGEEPVGPNVELANRTHPGRGLEFATVPGRMTYSGSTGVNIDGGYAYGDPRRYTRGWALHNGLGDPTQCDALCKAQPECQSPGNTCTSQAYEADGGRCYCSYASTVNRVIPNAPGVGGHGGTCVCPDGAEYPAGDNNDHCASLACEGGTMKNNQCNSRSGPWSHQKVICAPPTATPPAGRLRAENRDQSDARRSSVVATVWALRIAASNRLLSALRAQATSS